MGQIGTFQEIMKNRGWGTEMLDNVAVKNRVYGLIELDLTRAREYMRSYKEKAGETLSFTGWIVKCVGQAVSEGKQVQAYGKGKNRFVIFDDANVFIVVELEVGGQKLPVPYVVGKTNEKSFRRARSQEDAKHA